MCPWHMTDRGRLQAVISGRTKGEGISRMGHPYNDEMKSSIGIAASDS